MHVCSPVRSFLYLFVFACASILLGLTAYRIHYTETLSHGDILTSRTHFYDPIIAELLVTSCLAIMFCLWWSVAVITPFGGTFGSFASEQIMMWIIWVMYLVGAAITTHRWSNLKWCRGSHHQCRILEVIKAFAWIAWGFTFIAIIASLAHVCMANLSLLGAAAGEAGSTRSAGHDHSGTGPDTSQVGGQGAATTATNTTPVTHTAHNTAANPVAGTV